MTPITDTLAAVAEAFALAWLGVGLSAGLALSYDLFLTWMEGRRANRRDHPQ